MVWLRLPRKAAPIPFWINNKLNKDKNQDIIKFKDTLKNFKKKFYVIVNLKDYKFIQYNVVIDIS